MSLTRVIARNLTNYENRDCFGARLRLKRLQPLMTLIEQLSRRHDEVRILDVGGMEEYWQVLPDEFLERNRVCLTLSNLPQQDKPENHDRFRFVVADGCDLHQFERNSFHVVHSNSVVEHVGDWANMVRFAREVTRVGERYFVQTPNYWFPVEPHCVTPFFHWLPKPARIALVQQFALGNWPRAETVAEAVQTVESARLLNRKMLQTLFPEAELQVERFCGLNKSMVAMGPRNRINQDRSADS